MNLGKTPLSRRGFMTAAAAGMVAGAWPLTASATPNRGGHARHGVRGGSSTDSLDPATWNTVFMRTMGYGYCNTLAEIDGTNSLKPELLESWDAEPGAKTWIFRLRPGVTFHNGKSLTADDVIANVEHHKSETSKSGVKALLKPIERMVKEDDLTIRFELESGNADFPNIFADYRLVIMPSEDGVLQWKSGIGTGGYVLKNFEPGVRAVLERNPDYWRENSAYFDSAEVILMQDVTSRQNALMTGSVDIIDQVDLKTVNLLKRAAGVDVAHTNGGLHYSYAMNCTLAPFNNPDVRLALKYGVDREALVSKILKGYGTVGNDHPIAPGAQFFDAELEQRSYDPDRAKHHLKKAGLDRLDLSLSASDAVYAGAVDGAILYKDQLAAAGVDLTISREPSDGYYSNVWMKKPFVTTNWNPRPTADIMFSTAYAGDAPWNDTFWQNERFNQLLTAARAELDEAKRADMYSEMQRIVHNDGGAVIPVFASSVFAMSSKIGRPENMSGAWELDGGRSIERWWFK